MSSETTVVDFELRGEPGVVVIRFGPNKDPSRWGYPLLGLDYSWEASRGFPVIEATLRHSADGYAGVMSWLQVVRVTSPDDPARNRLIFDRAPQLLGLEVPYMSYGVRPVLFDAPSITWPNADWLAHALLAYTPDCVMTRSLRVLCGFAWGYQVRNGSPTLRRPAVIGPTDWAEDVQLIRAEFPSWTFEDE